MKVQRPSNVAAGDGDLWIMSDGELIVVGESNRLAGIPALPGVPHVQGGCRISASNDLEAMREWLSSKRGLSTHTQDSYWVAIKKFVWWLGFYRKALATFDFDDLSDFKTFCLQLPAGLPEDIPFKVSMAQGSVQQTVTILRGLFKWLVKARYIQDDPFDLLPAKTARQRQKSHCDRFLSEADWGWVVKAIDAMPGETQRDIQHKARCRWLMNLLYTSGLRLSEVVNNTMGGFVYLRFGEDSGWFLRVVGKGEKEREIPVPESMILALREYRQIYDLPAVIPPKDPTPLLLTVTGRAGVKRRAVAAIVDEIFKRALDLAKEAGEAEEAHPALAGGSTHWLRHTYGSRLGERGVSAVVIRDNLGHASIATSNQYVHNELMKRHRETMKGI